MGNFASISNLNQGLVRKALTGGFYAAPYTTAALTTATLFKTDGTINSPLTGYKSGGITTDDGVRFARAQEKESLTGWQYLEPVREDLTSDSETLQVDFMETNKTSIELYTGADLSNPTYVNGALSIQKPALPQGKYFRVLCIAVDNVNGKEFYIVRAYPRCKVSGWADQAFAKAGGLQWGMTFTSYVDPVLGYSKDDMLGGPGFSDVAVAMGLTAVPAAA